MPARPPRQQVLLLAGLLVVLAAVLAYQFRGPAGPLPAGQAPGVAAREARAAAARDQAESVPGVRLANLSAERSAPTPNGRELFRDKPPPPPPRPVPPPPDPNAPPPPPPPPPPITLKLIGLVRGPSGPVAALSDGRDVFFGREGDIIEGRYKIVKVNVESIDIAYVDGRGQRRLGLGG